MSDKPENLPEFVMRDLERAKQYLHGWEYAILRGLTHDAIDDETGKIDVGRLSYDRMILYMSLNLLAEHRRTQDVLKKKRVDQLPLI